MERYQRAVVESTGTHHLKPIYNRDGEVVGYVQDDSPAQPMSSGTSIGSWSGPAPIIQTVPTESEQWSRRPAVNPSCPDGQCGMRGQQPRLSCAEQCAQTPGCLGWSENTRTGACSLMYGGQAQSGAMAGAQADSGNATPRFWSVDRRPTNGSNQSPAMSTWSNTNQTPAMSTWSNSMADNTMVRDSRRLGFN